MRAEVRSQRKHLPETTKRANTGAECPKLLTHLLIREPSSSVSLLVPLPHSSRLLFLSLFSFSRTGYVRASAVPSDRRAGSARVALAIEQVDCERESGGADCCDMQIAEVSPLARDTPAPTSPLFATSAIETSNASGSHLTLRALSLGS